MPHPDRGHRDRHPRNLEPGSNVPGNATEYPESSYPSSSFSDLLPYCNCHNNQRPQHRRICQCQPPVLLPGVRPRAPPPRPPAYTQNPTEYQHTFVAPSNPPPRRGRLQLGKLFQDALQQATQGTKRTAEGYLKGSGDFESSILTNENMPATKLKELYLASNLKELNEQVDPIGKFKNMKWTGSQSHLMDKMFGSADTADRIEKDDELAYVLFMRFMEMFGKMTATEKKPYAAHASIAVKKAEEISNRLKRRYQTANDIEVADTQLKQLEFQDATRNIKNRKESNEKGVNGYVCPVEQKHDITAEELRLLMDQKSTSFLLIDTRSPSDFSSSHPKHPHSICISNVLLQKGVSANTLAQKLTNSSPESIELWNRRGGFDLIVLYDWNSAFEQKDPSTPIGVLFDAMTVWDPNTTYKGKIKILQGGYRQFYRMYPSYFSGLCPNGQQYEEVKGTHSQGVSLTDIAYPNLDDGQPPQQRPKPAIAPPAIAPPAIAPPAVAPLTQVVTIPKPFEQNNHHDTTPSGGGSGGGSRKMSNPSPVQHPGVHSVVVNPTVNRTTKPSHLVPEPKSVRPSSRAEEEQVEAESPDTDEIDENEMLPVRPAFPQHSNSNTLPPPLTKPMVNGFPSVPGKEDKTMEKLKPEGEQWNNNSSLKRSQSNPNLANMSIDEPPSFNRTQKPQTRRDFPTVSSTMRHHRTGLKNLGNTCYMNSIVQCLSHTRDLAAFLTSDNQKGFSTAGEVTKEIGMTVQQLNRGSRSFAPEELKRIIGRRHPAFQGYSQHDSHELLTFLLDWMHEELNKAPGRRNKLKEQKNENVPIETAYDTFRNDYLSVNNSLISQLFAGEQTSTIRCLACAKMSVTFEPFYFLSIPIPQGPTAKYTLDSCLDLYTTVERLDIDCTHCKAKGQMVKYIQLWRMPRYLLIHLQRFYNNGERNGNYRKKINEISFPLDTLDLSNRIKGPTTTTSNNYELYAVSNHYGSMENGHYTAFCRNPESWTKFDDADTSLISGREVCTTAAYILFYQARDDD